MRKGDWIQTYTGKQFYTLDPRVEDINIEDIAHALSMMCRYNGHCLKFYSVAEHSINVMLHTEKREYKLTALLHDASEAYIADITRPIKPFLNNYKEIESNLERVISDKFNLIFPLPKEIKDIDNRILGDEKEHLMVKEPAPWTLFGEELGIKSFCCWPPEKAKRSFLGYFDYYK